MEVNTLPTLLQRAAVVAYFKKEVPVNSRVKHVVNIFSVCHDYTQAVHFNIRCHNKTFSSFTDQLRQLK